MNHYIKILFTGLLSALFTIYSEKLNLIFSNISCPINPNDISIFLSKKFPEVTDILQSNTEAIVNPANFQLNHAGSLARAISDASGPKMQLFCTDTLQQFQKQSNFKEGSFRAVITDSFDLKSKHIEKIIHAVGPTGHQKNWEELLIQTYLDVFELAEQEKINSISFPAISAVIFSEGIITPKKSQECFKKAYYIFGNKRKFHHIWFVRFIANDNTK